MGNMVNFAACHSVMAPLMLPKINTDCDITELQYLVLSCCLTIYIQATEGINCYMTGPEQLLELRTM
jgi:hypothetical protein